MAVGVPVVGYETNEFPAFYSRESGLPVSVNLDKVSDIVDLAKAHWEAGMQTAVLVANPVPVGDAIPKAEMEPHIEQASKDAQTKKIHGKELTPFLLERINELTKGKSMRANLSLLLNNAHLAAQIAGALRNREKQRWA